MITIYEECMAIDFAFIIIEIFFVIFMFWVKIKIPLLKPKCIY